MIWFVTRPRVPHRSSPRFQIMQLSLSVILKLVDLRTFEWLSCTWSGLRGFSSLTKKDWIKDQVLLFIIISDIRAVNGTLQCNLILRLNQMFYLIVISRSARSLPTFCTANIDITSAFSWSATIVMTSLAISMIPPLLLSILWSSSTRFWLLH